jgi:hypothetical protein
MSNVPLFLAGLSLDKYGRVILSDDLAASISQSQDVISAGASMVAQQQNSGCTNSGGCQGSTNDWCSNIGCIGATNIRLCDFGPI